MKRSARRAFTMVELLTVLAVVGVLAALLLPAIHTTREVARRMQCANNLKQIGHAVHVFHDAQVGIPPSCIFNFRPSIWAILLPYIEQHALYDLLGSIDQSSLKKAPLVLNGRSGTITGAWFILALTPDQQNAFGSVRTYKCPSRRSGISICDTSRGTFGHPGAGPRGDYAIVLTQTNVVNAMTGSYNSTMNEVYGRTVSRYGHNTSSPNVLLNWNVSPFRVAYVDFGDSRAVGVDNYDAQYGKSWSCRDTMAHWQDGTSNQIIVGEKFIPSHLIDIVPKKQYETHWDGGWLGTSADGINMNVGRIVHPNFGCIKRDLNDFATGDETTTISDGSITINWAEALFGGIHPGIGMFLFGDGSVRPLACSTDWEMLYFLGRVDDGRILVLP